MHTLMCALSAHYPREQVQHLSNQVGATGASPEQTGARGTEVHQPEGAPSAR